jgi:hypothetical protein
LLPSFVEIDTRKAVADGPPDQQCLCSINHVNA